MKQQLISLLRNDFSVNALNAALEPYATSHARTAPAAVKRLVIKELERQRKQPGRDAAVFKAAVQLCQSSSATAKEIGALVVTGYYGDFPESVERMLYNLANDENWEVREWAASACGDILEQHFSEFYTVMESWAQDESPNVRRAVVLALMYAGKSRNESFAEPIINLIERLLPDRDRYVRENLGPFALGSALIDYYPKDVLNRIARWAASDDEQVRWNVAMMFSAATAAKYAPAALHELETLQSDDSSLVQRAVQKAMKNLQKRRPDMPLQSN